MLATTLNEENLVRLLEQGKRRAEEQRRPVLVSLTQRLQGETSALEVFLNEFPHKSGGMFWSKPGRRFWMAGSGTAVRVTASGEDRFKEVKEQTGAILEPAVIEAPEVRGTGPVFMGGFRYDTCVKKDDTWHDFPDALLTLPRFLLTCDEPDTWLTVNTMVEPAADVSFTAGTILEDLGFVDCPRLRDDEQPPVYLLAQPPHTDWNNHVKRVLQPIAAGDLVKVVLSRRKVLHARGKFSLDAALQRLIVQYPECVVFAVSPGDTTFIGATPEDLACLEEGNLSVSCLASSTARGENEADDAQLQDELFRNPKERAEHEAVTSVVAKEFEAMCTEAKYDPEPRPMKLKNIQHMLTSFTGSLKGGIDILDVVERLHPTPAVAGLPTAKGLQLINELEGDRGWYASPVGWVDRNGEGEFAVGIRSALVDGSTAYLYAGCGIVAGSEPAREYAETELKFEPMLNALGCDNRAF